MKIALCFIISREHILNKEHIWQKWIKYNEDIINVYFYYSDLHKIKSGWILKHALPKDCVYETSYFYVMPAYISLMNFAIKHDKSNQWFCFLTDACCPIISPIKFRYLFYKYYNRTFLSWRKAWWNIDFHKRANLKQLPEEYRLANDPWFIMKRENVLQCLDFINKQPNITTSICSGGLANESLFAIIMYVCKQLNTPSVISIATHATDWTRMSSSTSPHLFKSADELDIKFIKNNLIQNKFMIFMRKVAPDFPDELINYYIYDYSKKEDDKLYWTMLYLNIKNNIKKNLFHFLIYGIVFSIGIIICQICKLH